jgi:hypothetical protein
MARRGDWRFVRLPFGRHGIGLPQNDTKHLGISNIDGLKVFYGVASYQCSLPTLFAR